MANFWKGIVVGLGAIAPGLSGSVLLVIFGLYQKTITAISTIFQHFRKNIKFLVPLALGIGIGIVLFSKLVDFLLLTFPMQTRFGFLGLILGSIPLFYREVRKNGFAKGYYLLVAAAFAGGMVLFNLNRDLFPVVTEPTLPQSVLLGLAVATSYIVPGVDSAAILSALGLYNLWVHALATLNFEILFPALVGAGVGVLVVSTVMAQLIKRCYTPTFSIIFGLFLSTIPTIFDESCHFGWDKETLISGILLVVCFFASLIFSNLETLKNRNTKKQEP